MSTWAMNCSICDRTFEFDRPLQPTREPAPQHGEQHGGLTFIETPCPGSGQALLPMKGPPKR